jgi:Proteasome subunit
MDSQRPYATNLLIAGYDEGAGPSLYWMDYLATMHKMNVAGNGYGDFFDELGTAPLSLSVVQQFCSVERCHLS